MRGVEDVTLDVVQCEIHLIYGANDFIGEGDVADERVVGVDGSGYAFPIEVRERVFMPIGYDATVDIAGGADFEGCTVFGEPVNQAGIINDAHTVTDAVGVECFDGVTDVLGTSPFAGMDGDAETFDSGTMEDVLKRFGGIFLFISGKIDSNYATITEGEGDIQNLLTDFDAFMTVHR